MYVATALGAILASGWMLARWLGARGVEWAVLLYVFAACLILGYGYALASLDLLGTPAAWCAISAAGAALVAVLCRWKLAPGAPAEEYVPAAPAAAPRLERAALVLVGGTFGGLAILNLAVVLWTLRPNHDALDCHLPRTVHFWQQGNLDNYDATHWAQTSHPRHHPILMGFWLMVGGENLTQMVHYLSYLALIAAMYGIGQRLGVRPALAALSALVGGLLTNMLLVSTTTQNDMIIAAGMGCAVYLLLAFRATGARRYLMLAPLPVALLVGVKASALLCFPSLAVVAAYALWRGGSPRRCLESGGILLAAGVLASTLLVLPCGYLLTWRVHGSPIGPPKVRASHTFDDETLSQRLAEGGKNLLRFLVEFSYLDGAAHRNALSVQRRWNAGIEKVTAGIGIDLEQGGTNRRPPFAYRAPVCHEDAAHWGFLGVALVVPALVLGICRARWGPGLSVLTWAWLVFLLVQAFSSPYDPWRGRYFLWATALAAPVAALLLERLFSGARGGACAVAILGMGCFAALTTVLFRPAAPIWHGDAPLVRGPHTSVFALDRIARLTSERPGLEPALRRFEELVPADATVVLSVPTPVSEYAYLGAALTRRVLPRRGPLPPGAFYVYAADAPAHSADVLLGTDIHLHRHMKKNFYLRLPGASGP